MAATIHRWKRYDTLALLMLIYLALYFLSSPGGGEARFSELRGAKVENKQEALEVRDGIISDSSAYLESRPNKKSFGWMGVRTEKIAIWLDEAQRIRSWFSFRENEALTTYLNNVVVATFPYLNNGHDMTPFTTLRRGIKKGTIGIVIAAGHEHLRFTCHLITTLRSVLKSRLPIQVMYAGDEDFDPISRRMLLDLFPEDVQLIDLLPVFNDERVDLPHGTWAIKPFAMLASTFETVIGIDADAVFLQPPEVLLTHPAFVERGALLFHDRLLWQNVFTARSTWWHGEMKIADRTPSDTLLSSKVWTENFAEEADSGVVVFDKSRLRVLTALLHIAWQNTKPVREEVTYKMTYGDKESWWFGLALCNVPFAFEQHYGSMLGSSKMITSDDETSTVVCSFTIAHTDEKDALLWYNGSLLKNKATNATEFDLPDKYMMDGDWIKGKTKADASCMKGAEVRDVDEAVLIVIQKSMEAARNVDKRLVDMGVDLEQTAKLRSG